MTAEVKEPKVINIIIPKPHSTTQEEFVRCVALRQMIKAGRRFGKTVGAAIKALQGFLGQCSCCYGKGCLFCDNSGRVRPKRVLYGAPTAEQVGKFWFEVSMALTPGIEVGIYRKDETEHIIEVPRTETRIKAKTAWNANTLRGDYADLLILEEYQLMNEDAWQEVGQPMLLDNNGTAVFIFTPPSLKSEGISKAKDPRHASKMFKTASQDTSGRWKTFHFTSYDNPTLSKDALKEIASDMSTDTYRREILAEDDEIEASWLVYSKFNEELCKIKRFTIPDNWLVYSGHDFGTANPAALFVAQVKLPLPLNAPAHLRYGDYIAFAEYAPGPGYSAEQHIDRYKETLGNRTLGGAVGGNVTTEEETRQLYRKLGWPIKAPEMTKVNAQIERVIALIEQNGLYIFEDLHATLAQIADCMWVVNEDKQITNKVKDEAKYHLLACFRYLGTILNIKKISNRTIGIRHWD